MKGEIWNKKKKEKEQWKRGRKSEGGGDSYLHI